MVCQRCGIDKLKRDFLRDGKYVSGVCRICERRNSPSLLAEAARVKIRIASVTRTLSAKQGYFFLFEQQGGVCAICHKPEEKRKMAIDHNHETGEVRGLLCTRHNLGIGYFHDSVNELKAAIEYLQNPTVKLCGPKTKDIVKGLNQRRL